MKDVHIRKVQTSVTNFVWCGDYYLFLKRNNNKRVDPGRLNGVGGRVDPGENYLDAAIRETEEETGYVVSPENVRLAGVVKLEGGYEEDWVMCFFKLRVKNKIIPKEKRTEDGELLWIHKDKVLDTKYELVDDLNYSFKDIVRDDNIYFMTAKLNKNQKVKEVSVTKIKQ